MPTKKSHQNQIQIHFRDADPVGIMYFANLFSFAHDTFESFIIEAGISWASWFRDNKHIVPIRHAEADYLSPFYPGQTYQVQAQVESLSDSTFRMHYTFSQAGKTHAVVKMAHTFVDAKSKQKSKMPDDFRRILEPYLMEPA